MHYLRASKDLLISAPSIFVCLSWSIWSAPLSLPARSMKEILVKTFLPYFTVICKMACEREDSEFVAFCEVILKVLPNSITSMNSPAEQIYFSSIPIILILFLLSYLILS